MRVIGFFERQFDAGMAMGELYRKHGFNLISLYQ